MRLILTLLLFLYAFPAPLKAQSFLGTRDFLSPPTHETEEEKLEREERERLEALGVNSAVNQYDKKYRPAMDAQVTEGGLIPGTSYEIYFARTPDTPKDFATLRISQAISVNGCMNIEQDPIKVEKVGKSFLVHVSAPKAKIDKSIRNTVSGCKQGGITPAMEVQINHKDVLNGDLKQLQLKSPAGVDIYDISATKYAIHITPKSQKVFTPFPMGEEKPEEGEKITLSYWFYPEDMVVLYANDASADQDITQQITTMAALHNLIPASQHLKDFHPPHTQNNAYYFIDPGAKFANIQPQGEPQFIDSITVEEQFLGSEGAYTMPRKVDIFARKPGIYD